MDKLKSHNKTDPKEIYEQRFR